MTHATYVLACRKQVAGNGKRTYVIVKREIISTVEKTDQKVFNKYPVHLLKSIYDLLED